MAEPKPYSDKELKNFESFVPEHTQIHRFLSTIADLKRHIELDTAIKKDHRVKMAADRRELEKYRQGWLVKENKKLRERIEELEIDSDASEKRMTSLEEMVHKEQKCVADQTATIERLRGELGKIIMLVDARDDDIPCIHAVEHIARQALDGKEIT